MGFTIIVDFLNNPPTIHGARNSIRTKTAKPTPIKKHSRLFVKRLYSVRVISFSRVTKSGTRLNLAPSRTIVSTTNTIVNAAVSSSTVTLKPNRFGIKIARTRRLNPIPAQVITITQKVLCCRSFLNIAIFELKMNRLISNHRVDFCELQCHQTR